MYRSVLMFLVIITVSLGQLNWTLRNSFPTNNTLNSLTHGNGKYVAVGNIGTVLSSQDGLSWECHLSGTTSNTWGIR